MAQLRDLFAAVQEGECLLAYGRLHELDGLLWRSAEMCMKLDQVLRELVTGMKVLDGVDEEMKATQAESQKRVRGVRKPRRDLRNLLGPIEEGEE